MSPIDLNTLGDKARDRLKDQQKEQQEQLEATVGIAVMNLQNLFDSESIPTPLKIAFAESLNEVLERVANGEVPTELPEALPAGDTPAPSPASPPTPPPTPQNNAERARVTELERFIADLSSDLGTTFILKDGKPDLKAARQKFQDAVDLKVSAAKSEAEANAEAKIAEAETKAKAEPADAKEIKDTLKPLVAKAKEALKADSAPGSKGKEMLLLEHEKRTELIDAIEQIETAVGS